MKQYEIKEVNYWKGETFSYIVNLDEETFNKIKSLFEDEDFEGECYIIECNLTEKQVNIINQYSDNKYMDRIQFAELEKNFLDNPDFPYKGNGLILKQNYEKSLLEAQTQPSCLGVVKRSAAVDILDSDIATIEALHDLLLDSHDGYKLDFITLKKARELTAKMYAALYPKQG